jgi:hypothetical protein
MNPMDYFKKYIHTIISIIAKNTEDHEHFNAHDYKVQLHEDFINNTESKKHNLLSHMDWFIKKIKINHEKENNLIINRWKICSVDYGINIGTEINGIRPSIIFKSSSAKYGEDTIVIPITSYENIA